MPEPTAHEAAVEAVADTLWRDRNQFPPGSSRPAGWYVQQAKDVLAALATPGVREAVVRALNATEGWWDPDAARNSAGEALAGIRVWVLADAVLGALGGAT